MRAQWPAYGTTGRRHERHKIATTTRVPSDLGLRIGAGEGNRTLMTSLEGWGSAIELRPRAWRSYAPGTR